MLSICNINEKLLLINLDISSSFKGSFNEKVILLSITRLSLLFIDKLLFILLICVLKDRFELLSCSFILSQA